MTECGDWTPGDMCQHGPFKCGEKPCKAVIQWSRGGKYAQRVRSN